jgi:outer membrane murein-binding lipoprotein Lpp
MTDRERIEQLEAEVRTLTAQRDALAEKKTT